MTNKDKKEKLDIDTLVDDLCPVKPVMGSSLSALIFVFLGYGLVFTGVFLVGFRHDISMVIEMPNLMVQIIALFVAGLMAVFATFRLSCPREKIDFTTKMMIFFSVVLITTVIVYCAGAGDAQVAKDLITKDLVYTRLTNVFLLSLAPLGLMFVMMRRARPVHTSLIGMTSALAITAMSVMGCKLTCIIDAPYANLLWHYGPIAVLAAIGFLFGKYLYQWK